MHPDYIDELIRREQWRDWQNDQEQERLARAARSGQTARKERAGHFGLGRAIVKWLRAKLNPAQRQARSMDEAQPTLVFKR